MNENGKITPLYLRALLYIQSYRKKSLFKTCGNAATAPKGILAFWPTCPSIVCRQLRDKEKNCVQTKKYTFFFIICNAWCLNYLVRNRTKSQELLTRIIEHETLGERKFLNPRLREKKKTLLLLICLTKPNFEWSSQSHLSMKRIGPSKPTCLYFYCCTIWLTARWIDS